MTSKKAEPTDDDRQSAHKKGRTIKPLHEEKLKKQLEKDAEQAQANADMLAELAKRTAELAEKVKGPDGPPQRTLELDGSDEPKDIFATLDDIEEASTTELPSNKKSSDPNPAADVIRAKLDRLYDKEPSAETEAAEVATAKHRSVHQQFMYELTTSGKSLAEIQTEWHNYYVSLPNEEKHEVWQEFYAQQKSVSSYAKHVEKERKTSSEPEKISRSPQSVDLAPKDDGRSVSDVKRQLMHKVSAGGQLKPIHHVKSALFGLGLAAFVGLIVIFVFFNQAFIAPLISPSQNVSATPIIGDVEGPVSKDPKIIIPKINLEVPVVFGMDTIDEGAVQNALEDGVVHYASTPEPGEIGNSVIVGHSSNNILNSGRYKFAFVLLKRLEREDIFFVHRDGVRYTYKVFEKRIVPPTDTSVLGPADRDNTVTLITCDPPGTSLNRLIIVAEQVSPDPDGNEEADIEVDTVIEEEELPSNAPSLWSRFWPF